MPSSFPNPAALAFFAPQGISPDTASQLLHWLYLAAAVLAVVLLVVIAIAVIAWRKNRTANPKNMDFHR